MAATASRIVPKRVASSCILLVIGRRHPGQRGPQGCTKRGQASRLRLRASPGFSQLGEPPEVAPLVVGRGVAGRGLVVAGYPPPPHSGPRPRAAVVPEAGSDAQDAGP